MLSRSATTRRSALLLRHRRGEKHVQQSFRGSLTIAYGRETKMWMWLTKVQLRAPRVCQTCATMRGATRNMAETAAGKTYDSPRKFAFRITRRSACETGALRLAPLIWITATCTSNSLHVWKASRIHLASLFNRLRFSVEYRTCTLRAFALNRIATIGLLLYKEFLIHAIAC
jgi:hypothetical protein